MTIQSLYTFGNTANVNSNNFTTLYSTGAGIVNPVDAYGNANVASFLAVGSDTGGNLITDIVASGNIYAENIFANIVGNLNVPGGNTEILYNNNGNAGASTNLTFNSDTNLLSVTGNAQANYFIGDGSRLTSLNGANVSGPVANATFATSARIAVERFCP